MTVTSFTASPPLLPGNWPAGQFPDVRGVKQRGRLRGVDGTDIPGPDSPWKPKGPVLRVELGTFWNPARDDAMLTLADVPDTAKTITVDGADRLNLDDWLFADNNEGMRVNGPIVGNQVPVLRNVQGHLRNGPLTAGMNLRIPGGDVNDAGGNYPTSRAEVVAGLASPARSTPPENWMFPVGATLFWEIPTYTEPDHIVDTTGNLWRTLAQWKGLDGGSPPIALEHDRGDWKLGGSKGNIKLGPINPGTWDTWWIGVTLAGSKAGGAVEVWRNGVNVAPRRSLQTMDSSKGIVDPIYFKHGVYQGLGWKTPVLMHYGEVRVATSLDELRLAA